MKNEWTQFYLFFDKPLVAELILFLTCLTTIWTLENKIVEPLELVSNCWA